VFLGLPCSVMLIVLSKGIIPTIGYTNVLTINNTFKHVYNDRMSLDDNV